MSYRTIRAFNETFVTCRTRKDTRPMVWSRQSPGRKLIDHGTEWIYALVPYCQSCFTAARGAAPKSNAALWAAKHEAARGPFEKNLSHDIDPLS